jgi:nucleoside-diphosphate-sugar epimerase
MEGATAIVDATHVRMPGQLTLGKARRGAHELGRTVAFLLSRVRARSTSLRSYVTPSGLKDYAATGDVRFDESTPPASGTFVSSHLGAQSRALLSEAQRPWGLPLVMLRMGLICGPSGWSTEFSNRIRRGRGVPVGPRTNYSSMGSSSDVGEAIRAAVETAP